MVARVASRSGSSPGSRFSVDGDPLALKSCRYALDRSKPRFHPIGGQSIGRGQPLNLLPSRTTPKSLMGLRTKNKGVLLWAAVALAWLAASRGLAQTATSSVEPDADSFVRSVSAASNYGAGGALSVSGASAVNGSGIQNGIFDSLLRFPVSNVVAALNTALGGEDWIVTEARLVLTEMAVPDNAIFNQGVGAFEVRWLVSNEWTEGTGKPMAPTTDGVAWQDLPQILNSNLDVSLGVFTNRGANGQISFSLALTESFVEALHQGGEVGLYLTARSPEVGFTFNSRNFGNTNAQPMLVVLATVNPRPRIDAITLVGTNVSVSFSMVSNWTYTLQSAVGLTAPGSMNWSNLLTVPAQPDATNIVFVEAATNPQWFYRLLVSP